MQSIKFQADKNGKLVAFEWRNEIMRWVRMNSEKAQFLVASGSAEQVTA